MDSRADINGERTGKDFAGTNFYGNREADVPTDAAWLFSDELSQKDSALSEKKTGGQTVQNKRQSKSKTTPLAGCGKVADWFQTICLIRIPVIGWIYMFVLAIRKKTPADKRTFAIAYIIFRLLVLLLAIAVLVVLYRVGVHFVDGMLQYLD